MADISNLSSYVADLTLSNVVLTAFDGLMFDSDLSNYIQSNQPSIEFANTDLSNKTSIGIGNPSLAFGNNYDKSATILSTISISQISDLRNPGSYRISDSGTISTFLTIENATSSLHQINVIHSKDFIYAEKFFGKTFMGISSIDELNAFDTSTLNINDCCYWKVLLEPYTTYYLKTKIPNIYPRMIVNFDGRSVIRNPWKNAMAIGNGSVALGGALATGEESIAIGGSQAFGWRSSSSGGQSSFALGKFSHAEGSGMAEGYLSHTEGTLCRSYGASSHAEGYTTLAHGNYSHAEGHLTQTLGSYSHAEGQESISEGDHSHAEGLKTIAKGKCSHASGVTANAKEDYAFSWSGILSANNYESHGKGTFNINPENGINGLYIGDKSLSAYLEEYKRQISSEMTAYVDSILNGINDRLEQIINT